MTSDDTDFEWGYAETVHATCPECDAEVAIETDTREFAGVRCVACDVFMECDYR